MKSLRTLFFTLVLAGANFVSAQDFKDRFSLRAGVAGRGGGVFGFVMAFGADALLVKLKTSDETKQKGVLMSIDVQQDFIPVTLGYLHASKAFYVSAGLGADLSRKTKGFVGHVSLGRDILKGGDATWFIEGKVFGLLPPRSFSISPGIYTGVRF